MSSQNRQQSLKNAVDILDKNKKDAIAAAMATPRGCVIVGVIILAAIAFPAASVIALVL